MVFFRTPHSLALGGNTSKPKVVSSLDTSDERRCPGKASRTAGECCFEVADAITWASKISQPKPFMTTAWLNCLRGQFWAGVRLGRLLGNAWLCEPAGPPVQRWGPVRQRWIRFGSSSDGLTGYFKPR